MTRSLLAAMATGAAIACAAQLAGPAAARAEARTEWVRGPACPVGLEARANEPVLLLRPDCPLDLAPSRTVLRALLEKLYPSGKLDESVQAICLGRIEKLPWLSQRIVRAARSSADWDGANGSPRNGSNETFVAELLRKGRLARELEDVVAAFGPRPEIAGVEKVLVHEEGGVRVPYDGIVWLRMPRANAK